MCRHLHVCVRVWPTPCRQALINVAPKCRSFRFQKRRNRVHDHLVHSQPSLHLRRRYGEVKAVTYFGVDCKRTARYHPYMPWDNICESCLFTGAPWVTKRIEKNRTMIYTRDDSSCSFPTHISSDCDLAIETICVIVHSSHRIGTTSMARIISVENDEMKFDVHSPKTNTIINSEWLQHCIA